MGRAPWGPCPTRRWDHLEPRSEPREDRAHGCGWVRGGRDGGRGRACPVCSGRTAAPCPAEACHRQTPAADRGWGLCERWAWLGGKSEKEAVTARSSKGLGWRRDQRRSGGRGQGKQEPRHRTPRICGKCRKRRGEAGVQGEGHYALPVLTCHSVPQLFPALESLPPPIARAHRGIPQHSPHRPQARARVSLGECWWVSPGSLRVGWGSPWRRP